MYRIYGSCRGELTKFGEFNNRAQAYRRLMELRIALPEFAIWIGDHIGPLEV